MTVQLLKGAGKIKLVGETELIADGFDGQMGRVEQLHRALHSQVIEIQQRRVAGDMLEQRVVVRTGKVGHCGQRRDAQRFAQVLFHKFDAVDDPVTRVVSPVPVIIFVA